MFVRRKSNKTGSISIQVIDKSGGKYRVVKSLGTGRTEEELLDLERKAKYYIRQKKGLHHDLFEDEDERKIKDFVSGLANSQLQVIGPELIFGTLYDRIGYNQIEDKENMFRHLVITRLFNPGSKLKTIDYLLRYQGISYHRDKIYRFLDNLCYRESVVGKKDIKTEVERITFEHTKQVLKGKIDVVFYDMTTLYFEASDEDNLRKTGFSKDGKHQCPQIFLGLLVASGGNPIGYDIFEGNIFEGHSLIPFIQKMEDKYGFEKPIIIADSGLLSKKNIKSLVEKGYEYILGARPKNESDSIKKKILALNIQNEEVVVINKSEDCRLILSRTEKRAKKDAHNRKKGLQRLEKRITSGKLTKSGINNKGYNKYLRMDGDVSISIDMEKYEADAIWDGIKGYITNTKLPKKSVIENYRNLWFIERAFRMNKTDLEIRPIYHRLKNRIEAHICICFTAYSIMLELERILKKNKSKISLSRAQELTFNMYQLVYILSNTLTPVSQILQMDQEQQELYRLLGGHRK
ncbi:IS1634 family transposase [Parabacteroides sp. OttesenSCG-928-G07]|nr:IS1634 family transposase [Parabacteroides sp. OttesenSCG-928-G21]MDL2277126.1 IS1634 family transposase [Parabacteroides sp. OttesenSCG-928-G07]